jgi:dTMP kinase
MTVVFVVLEGLDASGKTTQAERLSNYLKDLGYDVYVRFHPSDNSWFGNQARRFLLEKGRGAHAAAAIFYIFDVIRSIFGSYWWFYDYVIYVRYLMGTAYLPMPLRAFAYYFFSTILPKPSYTFFLDVDPLEAHRRITESRNEHEMFESLDQLKKIGVRAKALARSCGWIFINANLSANEVQNKINETIQV